MIVCQNCGYQGNEKYCSKCGQVLEAKRINLPHLIQEVIHTFTHLEKKFLYTMRELALHPGIIQKNYLSGIRLHYQKPFPMFTICGTFCATALYLIYRNAADATDEYFYKNYYFLVQAAMLPFYSLITYFLFYSSKLYYAEALVLNVYMVGFMSVIIIPINLLSYVLANNIISLLEIIFLLTYNVWTYVNFFKEKTTWWIILKSMLSIVLSYLIFNYASRLVMAWFM